jgi:phosphoglycolate phosphatase-like HAD superfamily hydrolase
VTAAGEAPPAYGVTVAFDWNGTLADDVGHAVAATNAVLAARNADPLSEQDFQAAFTLPLEAFFAALGLPEDEVAGAVAHWNAEMASRPAQLSAGAADALRALRRDGVRLGVISAASSSAIEAGVRRLAHESGGELDFVVAPAADKVKAIEEVVRVAQGPVLYVGDTEYDIASARQGGARAVGFTAGYRPRRALEAAVPEWVVDDMTDVVAIARDVYAAAREGAA